MPCWTSPWPVPSALDSHLQAAGLRRCSERLEALPGEALVVYSPPDGVLAAALASSPEPPMPQQLAMAYRELQSFYGRHRLIAAWRLQAMTPEAISGWLEGASTLSAADPLPPFPDPEPLSALLAKTLIDSQPLLLEAYLDLELIAELAGGEPDTAYPRRLSQAIADSRTLLEHCWRPHQQTQTLLLDKAAQIAREDALAVERQQALDAEARLRLQVARAREEHERLARTQQTGGLRLRQLEGTVMSQAARFLRLEADLHVVRGEREEARRDKDRVQSQLAALNQGIAQRNEEVRRARDAEAKLLATIDGLKGENQRAREEGEAHQRARQEAQGRQRQLDDTVASQAARILRLETDLQVVRGEREEAWRARDGEAKLLAKVEELKGENQRVREEGEEHQRRLHDLLDEHERLFLDARREGARVRELEERIAILQEKETALHQETEIQQGLAAQAGPLRDAVERERAKVAALEGDLARYRSEHQALEAERNALLLERAVAAREREALELEKGAVLAREADLQNLLASHDQEARQARDAEVRLLDRVGQMERENQRMREESEGMRQESEGMRAQLQHLRDERERHTVADQTRGFHLRQLEDTIAAQTARISGLEADGETLRGERDRAWQERDEALRQARATEAELQTKVRALDVKAGNASEETRRLMAQIHHLHEELEQTFLQGQAGDQLIAAQHQQLVRAQSLMARLLVQTNQTSLGTQAVAVEVLPPQAAKAISGSTQGSGPERQGRGGGLLRRFWTP